MSLEAAAQRPWGAGQDGAVHGTAPATDGPPAAVEERQVDRVALGGARQLGLRPVEQPGRGEGPRFLRRIGVAQHHLLPIPSRLQVRTVDGVAQQVVQDAVGALQGVGQFEQGHDVDGVRVQAGAPRQLEDGQDIPGRVREADDVPVAALGPEGGLHVADRLERLEDVADGHAGGDLHGPDSWPGVGGDVADGHAPGDLDRPDGSPRNSEGTSADRPAGEASGAAAAPAGPSSARRVAACTSECCLTSSDRAWNPKVCTCQIEILDLAVRDALQPVGHQGVPDLAQLGDEVRWGRVAGARAAAVHQAVPCLAQALGDATEAAAVRLVGEAAQQLVVDAAQLGFVLLEPLGQRRLDVPLRLGVGHRVHEARGHGLEPVEHVVGADGRRLARDVGRDVRVPVAVGAHPGVPAQEGPDGRRSGPAPAAVPCRPSVRGRAACGPGEPARPIEGSIEGPVEAGSDDEE